VDLNRVLDEMRCQHETVLANNCRDAEEWFTAQTESLECTVAETEAQYSTQLAQMQCLMDRVENQLAEIRCDLKRQNQVYKVLLDTKARLECEINTYRGLLEREDSRLACNPCSTMSTSSSTREPCSAYIICTVDNCCA
jgi:acidic type I keratin